MPPRQPRTAYITRADAETMIAEAIAAERARSEQALAGVMLALGGAAQAMDILAGAVADAEATIEVHDGLLRPMAEAFAAGLEMTEGAEAPAAT